MRYLLLLITLQLSFFSYAQTNSTWFQYDPNNQTYYIDASNVHPAAFFKQFSLSSGIEIQFDRNITSPMDFYSKEAKQSQIINFLEKEFSTLLTFKKNKDHQEVLTHISILPKGQFQSSRMITAVDPIEEAIYQKTGKAPATAKPIYLTRMDHLETRVRENLERQTERTIKKQEARQQEILQSKQQKQTIKQARLAELETLKQTDPKLYSAKKAIYFPNRTEKE